MIAGDNLISLKGFSMFSKSVARSLERAKRASGGRVTRALSQIRQAVREVDQNLQAETTAREEAIAEINEQLGGGTTGHVLKRPNELLIMDHEDPEFATQIWRWNMGGLGYSSNVVGADNPGRVYSTAMTMDGKIVADFILTGALNANLITTGLLQSADHQTYINLDTGAVALGPGQFTTLTASVESMGPWGEPITSKTVLYGGSIKITESDENGILGSAEMDTSGFKFHSEGTALHNWPSSVDLTHGQLNFWTESAGFMEQAFSLRAAGVNFFEMECLVEYFDIFADTVDWFCSGSFWLSGSSLDLYSHVGDIIIDSEGALKMAALGHITLMPGAGGNVGIGTLTPEALMHVNDGDLLIRNASGNVNLILDRIGSAATTAEWKLHLGYGNFNWGLDANGYLVTLTKAGQLVLGGHGSSADPGAQLIVNQADYRGHLQLQRSGHTTAELTPSGAMLRLVGPGFYAISGAIRTDTRYDLGSYTGATQTSMAIAKAPSVGGYWVIDVRGGIITRIQA